MTRTEDRHRPLLSGIKIISGTGQGPIQRISAGTLTGVATRNSDGKKVLVTNLHVMAGTNPGPSNTSFYRNPTGGEEMYQGQLIPGDKVGSLPPWDPNRPAWVPMTRGQNAVADVALCELEEDVEAPPRRVPMAILRPGGSTILKQRRGAHGRTRADSSGTAWRWNRSRRGRAAMAIVRPDGFPIRRPRTGENWSRTGWTAISPYLGFDRNCASTGQGVEGRWGDLPVRHVCCRRAAWERRA